MATVTERSFNGEPIVTGSYEDGIRKGYDLALAKYMIVEDPEPVDSACGAASA